MKCNFIKEKKGKEKQNKSLYLQKNNPKQKNFCPGLLFSPICPTNILQDKSSSFYFNASKLCSMVSIFAKASASFLRSIAITFSGAPATNFSLDSLA